MGIQEEVNIGLALLRQRIERTGKLKVARSQRLNDRLAQYFVIAAGEKEVDFVLSHEFLSDLPNTKEYQTFMEEYATILDNRFEQPNPSDFYCRCGTGFNLEIRWPIRAMADRDA